MAHSLPSIHAKIQHIVDRNLQGCLWPRGNVRRIPITFPTN